MEEGLLYISADDAYLDDARESAQSAKAVMPETPIGIITDSDTPGDMFDVVVEMEIESLLNSHAGPRTVTSVFDNRLVFVDQESSTLPQLGLYSLAADGLKKTLRRIASSLEKHLLE